MKDLISGIKETFSVETVEISEFGRKVSTNFSTIHLPSFDSIVEFMQFINLRDNLKIIFTDPDENTVIILNGELDSKNNYDDFVLKLQENDNISICIEINKNIEDNYFSVYNWKIFSSTLTEGSIVEIVRGFNFLLANQDVLYFEILDEEVYWSTKTMVFSSNRNIISTLNFKRQDHMNACRDTSYFYNSQNLCVLPDDFLITTNFQGNVFQEKFSKIATLLSIAYISTTSSLENNKISCQISGQRNVNFEYELDKIKYNGELIKIFDWIYTDGNSVDKAIIARNIISLHCKYSDLLDTDSKTFSSIQSNYRIYLKDNVNNYLEAKGKVSEFICNIIMKIGDDATQLLSGFKSNIFAILGFIFTIVIVNIASTQPLDNIFTKDVTIILEIVLLFSLVYFIICLNEAIYKFSKNKIAYNNIKKNYKEIFSDEDFSNIFDEDKEFIDAQKSVKRGMIIWSVIWVVAIILMIVALENMSEYHIITDFIKSLIKKIKL